ncbi:TolC family protein [Thalassomonas viridans]|uniref:TolC family protein n=1 Tax=Thalassomonas viridans TaxID=137584 RepID=A0AAF0C800_9GAMM|nr:TolC family protein [Thalassomonas viridans]WDE05862.1 TolC family protein [Thalassomonas viridans]
MKRSPLFFSVISLCLLSACSTFEDVAFHEKANTQLKTLAKTSIDQATQASAVTLPQLLAIEEVNRLIDTALANNPGLQQTWLTLKTAKQQLNVSSASQWPDVSATLNANKQEDASASYNPSVTISWTADIWQQLADATSAREANLAASAHAYQGARDLLAANIMQSYIALVQYAQLVEIEERQVQALKTNEKVIVDRYRKGLTDLKDLDTAKSSTQSSQATLVEYREQYQQALRNLSLLTGVAGTGVTKNPLIYRTEFPEVITPLDKIDTQNLARRPDLQQAYHTILADQYQHKVAYKALLPNLSLSASLSDNSTNLHDALFGSNAWQLLGQLSAPIFNAGKLKSEAEIARLNAEKSYWAFQETLLTAVNEVDNALAQEQALTRRLSLTESALQSARRSEVTYTERYRLGTVSLIDLLQVQQQTFSLQAQVTRLTYQKLTNRITLGLALGLGV